MILKNNLELKQKDFKNEKELQNYFEVNLSKIMNYEFIDTEFCVGNFRIDTLAFDNESKSFRIIEYKNVKNHSLIDQGYTYLKLMLERKADFVLQYNIKTKNSLTMKDIDWSQSRIIFVSPSYTQYQLNATDFKNIPVDLIKVTRYENNIVNVEFIKKTSNIKVEDIDIASQSKSVSKEIIVYTEEDHLNKTSAEIRNIYENTTGYIGLFAVCAGNTIKDIGITGYMETTIETYAGGLISYASHVTTVECNNCYTNITIIANNANMVGGLIGRGGTINLENCHNLGNITANKGNAGGLIGYTNTTNMDSCYNQGNVIGSSSGGIVGYSYYSTPLIIINSYNSGKITGKNAGGIVGDQNGINSIIEIKNTYNLGNVVGTNVVGILNSNVSIPTVENCYNAGTLEGTNSEVSILGMCVPGGQSYIAQGKILNCFFIDTTNVSCIYTIAINDSTIMSKNEIQSQLLVDKLNSYKVNNSENWKKWRLGEEGYPIFE